MGVKEEIERLRAELREHDRRYYIDDDPSVSDEEYDRLFRRLLTLEKGNPALRSPASPTRRGGGGVAARFTAVDHAVAMLSLDNSYDEADIRAWDARVRKVLGRAP